MPGLIQRLRIVASMELGHRLVRPRPDDQFLVSYPRSGNTWLRTVLVNHLHPEAQSNPDVFNAEIPGVTIRSAWLVRSRPSPRLIKSHSAHRASIPRAVYIVRDGRDVFVSYYHFQITRRGLGGRIDLPRFFEEYVRGVHGSMWHDHVRSWLVEGRERLGDDLLVVRFEELRSRSPEVLVGICRFLGLSDDASSIERALAAATIERMREIERQREGEREGGASFYRGGKTGGWREADPRTIERFVELSSGTLELAGYGRGAAR